MAGAPTVATSSLLAAMRDHAARRGADVALTDDTGSYTLGQLWATAERFAGRLRRAGVTDGAAVGIAMEGSAANVAALFGALLAGAAAAPVNTALTRPELARYLELLEPALVVTDGTTALPGGADTLEADTDAAAGDDLDRRLGVARARDVYLGGLDRDAGSAALLFPTGGTTGLPKAAMLSHRATQRWATSMAGHGRAGAGTELFFLPFFHVGLLTGLLSTLHAGAPVVVQRRFDPEAACERIIRDGASRVQVVPTHLHRLMHAPGFDAARMHVRHVRFGGMSSAPGFVDELLDALPNAEISTGYGSTEFGPVAVLTHDDLVAGRRRGVGRAVPGVHLAVVDDEGVPVAAGVPGDVVVRCPWQASGYLGRPDESAAAFTPAGVRLADVGSLDDDGWLTLLGRRSEMVITGGENVFPAEVEAVLVTHPDIAEVIVLGAADETWGERVEAVVVARPGASVTTESLRVFARDRLAPYKLPRSVRIVDRIPLTPNNKPDRRALLAHTEAPPA